VLSWTACCWLVACDHGRDHVAVFPRIGAEGPVATCPTTRANVDARNVAGPDTTRCAYHDALGGLVVELSGSVRGEVDDGAAVGPGFAELEVSLHLDEGGTISPKAEGRARTDTQGHFHFSALVEETGTYVLLVRAPDGGAPLARQRIQVAKGGPTKLSGIAIVVPLDRDLSALPPVPPAR
jgi:hypothetical protein